MDDANKGPVFLITTLSSFLTPFMSSSITVALPSIAKEFKLDAILLSWVPMSYVLTGAVFLVPFGRAGDIWGRKRIFQYGAILYTLSSMLLPFSISATFLIAFRICQGFAASMVYSTGLAMLTSAYPPGERGSVLGINVAAVYSGLSLGPFLGGLLTQHFGWRSLFFSILPVCFAVLYYSFWRVKGDWAEAKEENFDWWGAVVYSLSLILLIYGFSQMPGWIGGGLILAGILGLLVFSRWETKAASPILDIGLFRENRVFIFSNLACLIHYSATFSVAFLLSLYLQYTKGLSPKYAGLVLVAQPVVQAIFSPFAGKLSDRMEPQIVASFGMGLTAAGISSFIFLKESTTLLYVVIALTVLGFGFALFISPNVNAVMSSVETRFLGLASAVNSTMRQAGQMLSMGTVTVIFTLCIGRVQITPEHYGSFLQSVNTTFVISALLCCGGVFASLARGKG